MKKLKSFFKNLFSPTFSSRFLRYVSVAYPIVKVVALYTPNKMDDEILDLSDRLGVKSMLDGAATKGEVLKNIAVLAAHRNLPNVPKELVTRAVEVAYQQMMAEKVQ
jgi:hypothetical protein